MTDYFRPLVNWDQNKPDNAIDISGGPAWANQFECMSRSGPSRFVSTAEIPSAWIERISSPRGRLAGLSLDKPRLMGVLNVTPDSFSDGGQHADLDGAVNHANTLIAEGADILDIGGESTRPGADFVENETEISRTLPVIQHLIAQGINVPISIDTRKSDVAEAALGAGAKIFNDVTALSFDPRSIDVAVQNNATVCLMHASGDPKTMQQNAVYDDVVLDVYDYLKERVDFCLSRGMTRDKIMIDPGIGFGKTTKHNLKLLSHLSLFHGLGCAILLGVSRKRFIGEIGRAEKADDRVSGSIAVALDGLRQGVQLVRVHDVWQMKQASALWEALSYK